MSRSISEVVVMDVAGERVGAMGSCPSDIDCDSGEAERGELDRGRDIEGSAAASGECLRKKRASEGLSVSSGSGDLRRGVCAGGGSSMGMIAIGGSLGGGCG